VSFWAAVQTEAQREHMVRLLLMRARYETYMPRIKARSRIAPLFPGYLFVRIVDRWYPVIRTVGVVRLLMSGDQPARLPERTMNEIRKGEGRDGFVKLPSPSTLEKGQSVRIIRGSFEGRVALCESMSSKERVWVLLNLMGQKVPVELPSRDLEPLPIANSQR
jgi:transcription antitermination factor NusG